MQRLALALLAALSAATFACAGNPAPGEEGYPYNVDGEYEAAFMASDGVTYTGTMQLATSAGGSVAGTIFLNDPVTITGEVDGTLVQDRLEISIGFEIPEVDCVGVVAGTGIVAEGGAPVEGEVTIEGECEPPSEATFRLTR